MSGPGNPPSLNSPTSNATFLASARRWRSHFSPSALPSRRISQLSTFDITTRERTAAAASSAALAQDYYNIVSHSYEVGWSTHFHYTPFAPGSSIKQSLKLYVHRLALLIGLRPGMRVLDVGCGIGGPAREIARLVGCQIVGMNINQYHVDRATDLTLQAGLGSYCTFVVGDYHNLEFPDGYFDAAYAVEAICHASDLSVVYSGIRRVVKKGGMFGTTEWAMTDEFDENNEEHRLVRNQIEVGNGIGEMRTVSMFRAAMKGSGWEIERDEDYATRFDDLSKPVPLIYEDAQPGVQRKVKSYSPIRVPRRGFDAAANPDAWFYAPVPQPAAYRALPQEPQPPILRPWYYPLAGDKAAKELAVNKEDVATMDNMSPWRRKKVGWICKGLVKVRIAAPESMDLIRAMWLCVDSVREGGRLGVFTPSWLFVSRNGGEGEAEGEEMGAEEKVSEVLAGGQKEEHAGPEAV